MASDKSLEPLVPKSCLDRIAPPSTANLIQSAYNYSIASHAMLIKALASGRNAWLGQTERMILPCFDSGPPRI